MQNVRKTLPYHGSEVGGHLADTLIKQPRGESALAAVDWSRLKKSNSRATFPATGMGAAALPLLGWRPDTNNAADGQDGIEHSFAYGGVGVVRLLPVDRERPGQTRFKHRKISVILLAPPRHGRGIDNFPLVDKQPNVDVAVRSVIPAHATAK